jgi:hypothetical protein
VACIKDESSPAEEDFEPRAEIHRIRVGRHANIAQIAGAIASRDIHAAAQRHSEMREVATYTYSLVKSIERGSIIASVSISKRKVAMDKVADRLRSVPPGSSGSKCLPRKVGELEFRNIGFPIKNRGRPREVRRRDAAERLERSRQVVRSRE